MEQATKFLKKKENVILDATFQKKKYRDMMQHVAAKYHAALVIVQCVCPDNVVKQRLEDRLRKKSISDGRWEIYLQQKTTFEPFSSEEVCLTMDTSDESYEYRTSFLQLLLSHIGKVI
jgi:predicted kinase